MLFLAQKERLDGFSPVVFALRTVYFMSLFAPQKDGQRVRVSLQTNSYIQKEKAQRKNPCAFSGAEGETRRVFTRRVRFANSLFYVPFCSAKRWTKSSSLSALFALYRKKVPGKIPIPFLAQKERLDGFSPVVFALRTVYFMSLFAPQKDGRRVRVSLPFLHYTEKRYRGKSRYLSWRRRRDSNSRAGYPTYALSRGASSPT